MAYQPHILRVNSRGPKYVLQSRIPCGDVLKVLDEQRRRQDRTLCDATLSIEHVHVLAHKAVLARSSRYFERKFGDESKAQQATTGVRDGHHKRSIKKHRSLDSVEPSSSSILPPTPKRRSTTSLCQLKSSPILDCGSSTTSKTNQLQKNDTFNERAESSDNFPHRKNSEVIPLLGIRLNAFLQVLDYMYTSELCIKEDNVQDILLISCLLQIPSVLSACHSVLLREPQWNTTTYKIPLEDTPKTVNKTSNTTGAHKRGYTTTQALKWASTSVEKSKRQTEVKSDENVHGEAENQEINSQNSSRKFTSPEKNATDLSQQQSSNEGVEVIRRSSERKFSRSPKHKILDRNIHTASSSQASGGIKAKRPFHAYTPVGTTNLQKSSSVTKTSQCDYDSNGILDLRQKPRAVDDNFAKEVASSDKSVHEPEYGSSQGVEEKLSVSAERKRGHQLPNQNHFTNPKRKKVQCLNEKYHAVGKRNFAETVSSVRRLQSQVSLSSFPSLSTSGEKHSPVPTVLVQPCSEIHPHSYQPRISYSAMMLRPHACTALSPNRLLQASSLSGYHATTELPQSLSSSASRTIDVFGDQQAQTTRIQFPAWPFIPKFQSPSSLSTHYSPFPYNGGPVSPARLSIHEGDRRMSEDKSKPKCYDRDSIYHEGFLLAQYNPLNSKCIRIKESVVVADSGTDTDSMRAASVDSGLDTDHNRNNQLFLNSVDDASPRAPSSKAIGIIAAAKLNGVSPLTRRDENRLKETGATRQWVA